MYLLYKIRPALRKTQTESLTRELKIDAVMTSFSDTITFRRFRLSPCAACGDSMVQKIDSSEHIIKPYIFFIFIMILEFFNGTKMHYLRCIICQRKSTDYGPSPTSLIDEPLKLKGRILNDKTSEFCGSDLYYQYV